MTLTEAQIEAHRCRTHGGYHFHAEAVEALIAEATQHARAEALTRVEEWFSDIDLDDLRASYREGSKRAWLDSIMERDQARAEAVAATTKLDDLRHRVEALAGEWEQGQRIPHGGPSYAADLREALREEL